MLATVLTAALVGLDGHLVEVQVDIAQQGLPNFFLVGLASGVVREARERVRTAIKNSGLAFPMRRITVNLAPAELPKSGPSYDLPLALAILVASGQVGELPRQALFLGELSLDGQLRHTAGVLPLAATARRAGLRQVYVPAVNAAEAALLDGLEVLPVCSLGALVSHLRGEVALAPLGQPPPLPPPAVGPSVDLADVRGQEHAKRALEIAAAGGHNVLLTGPPGAGKTLLARAVPGILPPLTAEETLEVTRIYSVAGLLGGEAQAVVARPFRAPHHTASYAGLVGGGAGPRPGEISLAHRGVLFLDEIPEFSPRVLEVMRQPMEDGTVSLARARGALSFPAKFMLVAARNPCPCGYFGDSGRACACPPNVVTRYEKRLSGPILDRIDLHVSLPRVEIAKLTSTTLAEGSAAVRARVVAARERQWQRLVADDGRRPEAPSPSARVRCNADLQLADVRILCEPAPSAFSLLHSAVDRLGLSARAYHRVLRVARTIADLAAHERIEAPHIAEAIQYQPRAASWEG